MGFDSKCNFAPPTILLELLLCLWMWGIFFLNGIQHSTVEGCSAVSCNFGVPAEDDCTSFYFAICECWFVTSVREMCSRLTYLNSMSTHNKINNKLDYAEQMWSFLLLNSLQQKTLQVIKMYKAKCILEATASGLVLCFIYQSTGDSV